MNRKRKFIIVSVILILIIMIGIIYKIKFANTKEKNNNIEVSKKETVEMKNENIVQENKNMIRESVIVESNTINENKIVEELPKEAKINEIVETPKTTEIPKQEIKTTVQTQETISKQEVVIEKPAVQPVTPTVPEESKVEEPSVVTEPVVTQPVVNTPTEEYRYNDSMTQTMIAIINSNPSEFMKTDGFSVVVDSSITSLTNQFTFTEERVKNKIAFKAGTIRVYAQDYYYNGELLFTECYIF